MAPAPWEEVPSQDTLFVLVTGTNSGIGLGIGQRLIDEYLATRSLHAHLVLIATTRSAAKSKETIHALQAHARKVARTDKALKARAGPGYAPKDTTRRIHLLSAELDLCDFPSVYRAADQVVHGTLSSVGGSDNNDNADGAFAHLEDVRIPRLDRVIFNAGVGGWIGLDWAKVFAALTYGIVYFTSYPFFKLAQVGVTVDPLKSSRIGKRNVVSSSSSSSSADSSTESASSVGWVWCANTFGHYLFAHALMPLLRRPRGNPVEPGRVIWTGSLDTEFAFFSMDDFQGVRSAVPYESSKRVMDMLVLTADLPSSRKYSARYLGGSNAANGHADANSNSNGNDAATHPLFAPPKMYLCHPGVINTDIVPGGSGSWIWFICWIAFYLSRWCGSPWHPVTGYKGATAAVWLALQEQAALDANRAERCKWGSSTDFWGADRVKKTEVEGWGWDGVVEDPSKLLEGGKAEETGVARKIVGRKFDIQETTPELLEKFAALGAGTWREMERLRGQWEPKAKAAMAE